MFGKMFVDFIYRVLFVCYNCVELLFERKKEVDGYCVIVGLICILKIKIVRVVDNFGKKLFCFF